MRRVGLSRRLRAALLELQRARFAPPLDAHVLPDWDPSVFRRSEWRRILKAAKIGHRNVKDLRDTFASQLLTAGVPLAYVSAQLGHSNVGVTAQHYARWAGGEAYRKPLDVDVAGGELPADLLARLESDMKATRPSDSESGNSWWSLRESNPCLQGENLIS